MSSVAGRSAKSDFITSGTSRDKSRPAAPGRFERAVDPDGLLSPEERAWRAEQLRAMRKLARFSRRMGVA
ncbi:hypothetical protein [Nocardia wallacei]|uniref:hypothetical protein n=1 Tax=Nocardia wallacei TaxID=480035 RepID=UPI00245607C1|nr:hypothetical protein [Nocardia wallacei]